MSFLAMVSGQGPIVCSMRRMLFRLEHCAEGNSNPAINLDPDAYGTQVQRIKDRYGKSDAWQQWMLSNRARYEGAFLKSQARPYILGISFRYQATPIAYSPPWSSEAEHMLQVKAFAEPAYPGFNFDFQFDGDTASSYANVIAGIPSQPSYASGKDVHLYYETIFNHEFGHVMGLSHHYDNPDDPPKYMPPGETLCIMARNWSQWCSACRTALCIELDVDYEAEIDAALAAVVARYPY